MTPGRTPVFVGHNPMFHWGGDDTIWINPLQTQNHVILYSGAEHICPYIAVRKSDGYTIKYANLKIRKKRFVLD
jgi:hypothetical protein